ncbi:DUF2586 family protein [Hymenobacter swuensis]|uniref:Uncharacterized protein n=1 Tax=Hymenobacter swuensis DY53 TaxID=1227739 RepID=W8F204_9BACT|nr:DUF2586 family protein [Hymenobacter swuensis]AHJ98933.1 hypothetical protein Hsw_3338 [Hymenobacter swuensis DY53]
MLPDVSIIKGRGGLGRQRPTEDGISGLLTQGVAVVGGLQLGTVYELRSLRQLEALGVDADYDTANSADLHYHVSEFFRLSQGGVLYLLVVARTVTMAQMADKAEPYAKRLLTEANGKIKQLALCLDSAASYAATVVDGLDGDVVAALPKAQALAAEEFAQHRPVLVLLAGHGLSVSLAGLLDLREQNAEYVALVIGTDHLSRPGVPAIGTALGTVSLAQVHENIGWLDKFTLAGNGRFLSAGLSNGKSLGELVAGDLEGLHAKGYLFAMQHVGFDGFFWNDSHTCTDLASDYAYIENVRTSNKAARVVRQALLPSLKGPLPLNADGTLRASAVGELEAKGKSALDNSMGRAGEISASDVYIDPAQDVLATSIVTADFSIVPIGTAREIRATVGFAKSV